jgi:hypothetical protein
MEASAADIALICGSLPEVELGISWGDRPTFKVPTGGRGRGFVIYRAPGKTAIDPVTGKMFDDLLVIAVPNEEMKASLVQDPHSPFLQSTTSADTTLSLCSSRGSAKLNGKN